LRDQARSIAPQLGLEKEFILLDDIIGTLLTTRKATLADSVAKAHQFGTPFDPNVLARVETLWSVLSAQPHHYRPTPAGTGDSFYTAAFFDAYFSKMNLVHIATTGLAFWLLRSNCVLL